MPPAADFRRLLQALSESQVEFIVVGGVSAVLRGAPISTFDLDIVPRRDAPNVERLLGVLRSLHAVFRGQFGRQIEPEASTLSGPGHNLLICDAGPLDVLGTIGAGLAFEDLLPNCEEFRLFGAQPVRVLSLAKLIEIKEFLGTEKDRAVLPILRRTLEEERRRGG